MVISGSSKDDHFIRGETDSLQKNGRKTRSKKRRKYASNRQVLRGIMEAKRGDQPAVVKIKI